MDRGQEPHAATDPRLVADISAEPGGLVGSSASSIDIVPKPGRCTPPQSIREVLLSVSWTFPVDHNATGGQPDYLDGSCLVYSEERLLDVVDFRGAHSAAIGCTNQKASSATYEWSAGRGAAAGILHSGDVMSPEGGTHVIRVRLADLPSFATDVFFAISAYNCRNLALFRSLTVKLLDADAPTTPLSKMLSRAVPSRASAIVVCSLARRCGQWSVRSVGQTCEATVRDYLPIERTIAPLQETHVRWRRRRALVLTECLLRYGRAHPKERRRGKRRVRDLVPPLVHLPQILFRSIVQFV